MGYRSSVAYSIRWHDITSKGSNQSFYTFLAEAKANPATSPCFTMEDFSVAVNEKDLHISFYTEEVKWYEGYEGVKAHTALLDMAQQYRNDESPPHPIDYKFVCVGEDATDITETASMNYDWDSPWVSRRIVVDD